MHELAISFIISILLWQKNILFKEEGGEEHNITFFFLLWEAKNVAEKGRKKFYLETQRAVSISKWNDKETILGEHATVQESE